MSNRSYGGELGRSKGYEYEQIFKEIIEKSDNAIKSIFQLKYGNQAKDINCSNVKITRLPASKEDLLTNEKKPPAADLLLSYKHLFVGIDTKKPSSPLTQWVRKRIPLFLHWANTEEKKVFGEYFNYNNYSQRTYVSTENKKEIIFNYINAHKLTMVKKRFRSDEKTWCDFLAHHEGNFIKMISIDQLLEEEFIISKMRKKSTNYSFGNWISFKPYGSSQPDMQIQVKKGIFDSSYCHKISL